MIPLFIILLSLVKKSCLVWIRREICTDQAAFTSQNQYVGGTFSLEEVLLLITNYILAWNDSLKLKHFNDGLEWCGLWWCFYQLMDSHSDGTHSLQRIHCWVSDVTLHFSKSDEETNSSTSWMAWAWGHFQQIFISQNQISTCFLQVKK